MLISRMVRALLLDITLYEEVEADKSAIRQALIVVILSSLAAGVGSYTIDGLKGVVLSTGISFIGWIVMALIIYIIGTKFFPESETRTDLPELFRTLGFATTPFIFRFLDLVPYVGAFIVIISWIWMLVAMIVAVKQVLDFKNTWNAIWVCVVGLVAYFMFYGIIILFHSFPKPVFN